MLQFLGALVPIYINLQVNRVQLASAETLGQQAPQEPQVLQILVSSIFI